MRCSAFIATSADGYIADINGGIDWLHSSSAKNQPIIDGIVDINKNPDLGFKAYIDTVDCMVMGRKCMEVISKMNLTPEQWPYGDIEIIVLSHSLKKAPQNIANKVSIYGGDIKILMDSLKQKGYEHVYVDGGATITSFINEKLINNMVITQAPVLLGKGITLFGTLNAPIKLRKVQATAYSDGFMQVKYELKYGE